MKTIPRHLQRTLAPLLLSLAVSQSYATEIVIVGQDGVAGPAATGFGAAGTAGGAAANLERVLSDTPGDGRFWLSLSGGAGGDGGRGAAFDRGVPGARAGSGGDGGRGAMASGRAHASADARDLAVRARVAGGDGGRGGEGGGACIGAASYADCVASEQRPGVGAFGAAGAGGDAFGAARAVTSGAGNVDVQAVARGGDGGAGADRVGPVSLGGADGGAAAGSAYGRSDSGRVSVAAEAYGGSASQGAAWGGIAGGSGGAAALDNAVSGSTRGALVLLQRAVGGAAGAEAVRDANGVITTAPAASGGAVSRLTLSDAAASALNARVSAQGGLGRVGLAGGVAGGAASAGLTLASTRAGVLVDGAAQAIGGSSRAGFGGGGNGGAADAVAHLSGRGDVRGRAAAYGGAGGSDLEGYRTGGIGGGARASLTLEAAGLASGSATARAGQLGANYSYDAVRTGDAFAILSMAGAGARGTASAEGDFATSTLGARTSGALAVDVDATARSGLGAALASVDVASGVGALAGGYGKVTARASASSADGDPAYEYSGAVTSRLDVRASGAIDGISQSRSGDTRIGTREVFNVPGVAASSARGVTSGEHAVSLRSIAQAGDTGFSVFGGTISSAAGATAFGQSGRGAVDVTAVARAGGGAFASDYDAYGRASASAGAVNLARGGRGVARAVMWGGSGDVLASASGIGSGGGTVRVSGAAATSLRNWLRVLDGSATASNYFEASAFRLAAAGGGGARMVSNAGAAPATIAEVGPLGPVVAAGMSSLVGVGMQGYANNPSVLNLETYVYEMPTASGRFEFDGVAGQHLLLGLVSASLGGAFESLELSITNHGVGLFSRTFTSADEASLFFNDQVLDLGLLGAGMQDVLVSTVYGSNGDSLFTFNYLLGTGVTAVPEASTWLMLLLGLGGVLIVARRRRAPLAN